MLLNNVAFLATDINTSRCYLQVLFDNNIIPSEIIFVEIQKKKDLKFYKKRIKSIIKSILFQKSKSPGKPDPKTENQRKILKNQLQSEIEIYLKKEQLPSPDYTLNTMDILTNKGLKFDQIQIQSINDPKLIRHLDTQVKSEYVIFSGGGILRKNILQAKRFIHVHPGVVPDVKGAHCFLWSALVRDKIGMSAFFMNEGIDTGDIITTREYPKPKLNLKINTGYVRTLGKYLIDHLDPSYRADLLVSLFKKDPDPANWSTAKQDPSDGKTYYFMHNEVMEMALLKLAI